MIYFIGYRYIRKVINAIKYSLMKALNFLEKQREEFFIYSQESELCQSTHAEILAEVERQGIMESWLNSSICVCILSARSCCKNALFQCI